MQPLNLRLAPPRPPQAEIGGVVFLPRSIDKLRAALPGGDLGAYAIEGFTTRMLDTLGIDVAAITAIVADAATEADVANYVTTHARPGGIDEWNAFVLNREIYGGDRAEAVADNPWLAAHPELRLAIEMLAEDDRRSFPAGTEPAAAP